MSLAIALAERSVVPDSLIRVGIRRLLAERLRDEASPAGAVRRLAFEASLGEAPIAVHQQAANDQHYEVPPAFFGAYLGPHRKYSSAWFDEGVTDLGTAEAAMLARSCAHAGLEDGQDILEIGCGWGSLSLWMAERYPNSRIIAVSNSAPQRGYIQGVAAERGLTNLEVRTCDITVFEPGRTFDRVVSIECFEHLRNYRELFRRISTWLKPEGRLWFHIFVHKTFTYPFEDRDQSDWMARHFFTGGQMPSFDVVRRFDEHLVVEDAVAVNGHHYAKTARAWLNNLDARRDQALAALADHPNPARQLQRWRIFTMACEELWGWGDGTEWLVGHYRMRKA